MTDLNVLDHFGEIAPLYDLVLCDVWGVIHNGEAQFPEACEALSRFQAKGGTVVLISNAPRPADAVTPQLDALGVARSAWSCFVTSGDATRAALAARAPGPAWAVGPARDASLFEGLGLVLAEAPDQARFIACTGLFDDETETPEDYRMRFEACARRDLEMICANPDKVVQRGERLIYCAGALAELYESLGGRVLMAGKPYAPVYDAALAAALELTGRPTDRARVLAIGDGVGTDVIGANNQGLDVLFVAAGIHARQVCDRSGRIDPARAAAVLDAAGARARFATTQLRW